MWSPQQHRIRTLPEMYIMPWQCTLAKHESRSSHGTSAAATAPIPHYRYREVSVSVVQNIYCFPFTFCLSFSLLLYAVVVAASDGMLVRHALLSQPQKTEIAQHPTTPKVPSSSSSVGGERLRSKWLVRGRRHVGSIVTARTGISLFLLVHMRSVASGLCLNSCFSC